MNSKLFLTAAVAVAVMAGGAYAKPDANQMAAVADANRPAADKARDDARKPAEMLEFAGVKPGMTVVDLIPGGGYFTRIFSKAVGPKGTVYAVGGPPRPATDPAKPPPKPPQDAIAEDPNYANVKSIHVPLMQMAIPTKADLVWTSQNYHDIHNAPNADLLTFNKAVYEALKPGGEFIVLDHVANADTVDATHTVHRIDPAVVKKEVEAAGFKFEGESKALANPADDHKGRSTDDGPLRGHTDQFIYKFRKPK